MKESEEEKVDVVMKASGILAFGIGDHPSKCGQDSRGGSGPSASGVSRCARHADQRMDRSDDRNEKHIGRNVGPNAAFGRAVANRLQEEPAGASGDISKFVDRVIRHGEIRLLRAQEPREAGFGAEQVDTVLRKREEAIEGGSDSSGKVRSILATACLTASQRMSSRVSKWRNRAPDVTPISAARLDIVSEVRPVRPMMERTAVAISSRRAAVDFRVKAGITQLQVSDYLQSRRSGADHGDCVEDAARPHAREADRGKRVAGPGAWPAGDRTGDDGTIASPSVALVCCSA